MAAKGGAAVGAAKGLPGKGGSRGAAQQMWRPRGSIARGTAKEDTMQWGQLGGYSSGVAANRLGLRGWQPRGLRGGCKAVMAAKRLQGVCGVHKLALWWVGAARDGDQGPALLWEQLGGCTAVWAATGLHGSGAEGLEGSQEAATQ